MCRYGLKTYKLHNICLSCRKGFKVGYTFKDAKSSLLYQDPGQSLCPECGQPMEKMGRDFKVPAKSDIKQWAKVELLSKHGFRFWSCGCDGPGYAPGTLKDAKILIARKQKSPGEELLNKILRYSLR